MPQYVCSGAMLKCSMGLAPSSLVVLPVSRVMNNARPQATIMDNKPILNIVPFGMCRSLANPVVASATSAAFGVLTPMPCIPNTPGPWLPGNPKMLVGNKPALTKPSKLMCAYAGVIKIVNPGQVNVKNKAKTSFKYTGLKRSVEKSNKKKNRHASAELNLLNIEAAAKGQAGFNAENVSASFDLHAKASALEAKADFSTNKSHGAAKIALLNAEAKAAGHIGYNAENAGASFDLNAKASALQANADLSLGTLHGAAEIALLNAEAKAAGHIGYNAENAGASLDLLAKATVAEGKASAAFGSENNPFYSVEGEFEFLSAKAEARGFIGKKDDKYGFAGKAEADASVIDGELGEGVKIPIPFTDWSVEMNIKGAGKAASAAAGVGAKAYYDKGYQRFFIGASGKLALAVGISADVEISIGKKYKAKRKDEPY
jgi:hypothetical protein